MAMTAAAMEAAASVDKQSITLTSLHISLLVAAVQYMKQFMMDQRGVVPIKRWLTCYRYVAMSCRSAQTQTGTKQCPRSHLQHTCDSQACCVHALKQWRCQ